MVIQPGSQIVQVTKRYIRRCGPPESSPVIGYRGVGSRKFLQLERPHSQIGDASMKKDDGIASTTALPDYFGRIKINLEFVSYLPIPWMRVQG
jgi:hypothetical protein